MYHPSEAEESAIAKVTTHTTNEAPPTDDVEVTPPVETHVTAPASTNSSVHIDEEFPSGPIDTCVFIGYADHADFRL